MSRQVTPSDSAYLRKATNTELVKHGLSLHAAMIWGALRASRTFRAHRSDWRAVITKRFIQEYGLNLLLLVLMQALILPADGWQLLIREVCAVIVLPLLSVAQVVSDRLRSSCDVYTDPTGNVGMTVKTYQKRVDGSVAAWAFLNHYALPVGRREGVRMRQSLHEQAQASGIDVFCHAQNEQVAEYYLSERAGGENLGGARPLLHWKYRIDTAPLAEEERKKFDIFGFSSLRDSGQVPLR